MTVSFDQIAHSVQTELEARYKAHRAAIALAMAKAAQASMPLNLLANGDSWFDYPLGGTLPGERTDVIAQLSTLAKIKPTILNLSHYGDATTKSLGCARQMRMMQALTDPSLGKFDAILISGGGDDIVGDQLVLWLRPFSTVGDPSQAIEIDGFRSILEVIESSYRRLFELRDMVAPGTPIFGHGYDYALPTGIGVCGLGPWLKSSLDYRSWTDFTVGALIVRNLLDSVRAALAIPRLGA